MISFEDFKKLDLQIAKITQVEKVEGADKLLKLQIDIGGDPWTFDADSGGSINSGQGKRQIVAGIAEFYDAQELVGREIVVVVNLEPRTLKGVESQGMLLAADEDGKPVLLMPDKEVPPGTKIR